MRYHLATWYPYTTCLCWMLAPVLMVGCACQAVKRYLERNTWKWLKQEKMDYRLAAKKLEQRQFVHSALPNRSIPNATDKKQHWLFPT